MKTLMLAILFGAFSINASAATLAEETIKASKQSDTSEIVRFYKKEMANKNSRLSKMITALAATKGIPGDGTLEDVAATDIIQTEFQKTDMDFSTTYAVGVPVQWEGTATQVNYLTMLRVDVASHVEVDSSGNITSETETISFDGVGEINWK